MLTRCLRQWLLRRYCVPLTRARAATKRLANAKEGCGVLSTAQLLRQSSVAPTTLRAYEIGVREFETYARNHKWKLKSGSAVGEAFVKYGAAMYELGEDAGSLRAAIYGMALFRPRSTASSQKSFPKSRSSSFRLVPSKARDPLPWLVLALFCDCRLSQGVHFLLPRHSCSLTLTFIL